MGADSTKEVTGRRKTLNYILQACGTHEVGSLTENQMECNKQKLYSFYRLLLSLIYRILISSRPRKLALYVIGSVAKNEISCIELENKDRKKLVISDLDVMVVVDLRSFIKYMFLGYSKIGSTLTNILRSKGLETHISITILSLLPFKVLRNLRFNTINFYEMKRVICYGADTNCHIVESTEKTRKYVINPDDALDLIVSSIADYIFVVTDNVYIKEAVYLTAKRILSLFYALELSLGLTPKGFTEVPVVAENNFEKISNIVGRNELKLLYIIANFKRNCDINYLRQNIMDLGYNTSSDNDLLQFLLESFERYVRKILLHFGRNINNSNIFKFIKEYEKRRKEQKLMSVLLNLMVLLSNRLILRGNGRKDVIELIIMFRHRLRLSDILRILVLKFLAIILFRGRNEVLSSPKLKDIGHNIAHLWHKYMI